MVYAYLIIVALVGQHVNCSDPSHIMQGRGRQRELGRERVFEKPPEQLEFVSARIENMRAGHFEGLCD